MRVTPVSGPNQPGIAQIIVISIIIISPEFKIIYFILYRSISYEFSRNRTPSTVKLGVSIQFVKNRKTTNSKNFLQIWPNTLKYKLQSFGFEFNYTLDII